MSELILAGENLARDGDISASSEATPASHLEDYRLDRAWRAATANATVTITWGGDQDLIEVIAVGGVPAGATIAADVDGTAAQLSPGDAAPSWRAPSGDVHLLVQRFEGVRQVQLTFAGAPTPEARWVYAGPAYRPLKNIIDAYAPTIEPGPGNRRTRTLSIAYPRLSVEEATRLAGICLDLGSEIPLVVIPQLAPASQWPLQVMLARLDRPPVIQPWPEAGRNSRRTASLALREVTA